MVALFLHHGTGSLGRYRKQSYCNTSGNLRRCNAFILSKDKETRCRRQNGKQPYSAQLSPNWLVRRTCRLSLSPTTADGAGTKIFPYNDARLRTFTDRTQHLAATSPNVEILQDFLTQGASVHLRNRAGNTPLFLAASAGLKDHVQTLLDAGAHLHSDEVSAARLHVSEAGGAPGVWELVIG